MANRKFGNYSSFNARNPPNRNFNQGPPSNISPWQVGASPSADPSQNIQNQIALALTNIIQSAQNNANKGPPSLFSLNTSPGGYPKQNRFNNQNNFSNKRDFKRSEPFKNRGMRGSGWRNDSVSNNRGRNDNNSSKRGSLSHDNRSHHSNSRENVKKSVDSNTSKQDKPSDNENGVKVETETKVKDEGGAKKSASCKYADIPKGLLHCFICNKSMWDGESFQNHVGGKAHKQMFNSLEESFQITVNILRENMRLVEERKMIEFERVQRSRKQHHAQNEPESHCNMCDLKFFGRIVLHRQSESHQRLKRFLHPKCHKCDLEFTSRMEWVEHLFQPEHLQKTKAFLENKGVDSGEYKTSIVMDIDVEPLLQEHNQNEDDHPVLEFDEDLTNLFNRIPVYKPQRQIAKKSLKPATGSICEICKVFMTSEEDTEKHLKSYKHYVAFVDAVKRKYQAQASEKKAEAVKTSETAQEEEEAKLLNETEDDVKEKKPEIKSEIEGEDELAEEDVECKIYDPNNEDEVNKLLDDIYMDTDLNEGEEDGDVTEVPVVTTPAPTTTTMRVTRRSANYSTGNSAAKKPRTN